MNELHESKDKQELFELKISNLIHKEFLAQSELPNIYNTIVLLSKIHDTYRDHLQKFDLSFFKSGRNEMTFRAIFEQLDLKSIGLIEEYFNNVKNENNLEKIPSEFVEAYLNAIYFVKFYILTKIDFTKRNKYEILAFFR